MRALLVISLTALALLLAACGDEDEGLQPPEGGAGGTAVQEAETTPPAEEATPQKLNGCEVVEQPPAREDGGAKKPKGALDASKTYTLVVQTNCGSFSVQLDLQKAPKTANSVVKLAQSGFYQDTQINRIVPDFIFQAGDQTGTVNGGPGYEVVDKPPANTKYTKGVVAMAKTPDTKPGTSGSQFFVVTGKDSGLPPEYAVLGKVAAGMKVVNRIGKLGDPASGSTGTPTQVVVIRDIKVKTS